MVRIQILLDDLSGLIIEWDLPIGYTSHVLLNPPIALRAGDFLAVYRHLVLIVVGYHFQGSRDLAHDFAHIGRHLLAPASAGRRQSCRRS